MTTGVLDPRTDMLIDMTQPVNLLHPLNRRRMSWWLALPGTTGGPRFMDIMSPGPNGNHGLFGISMNPVTDWLGASRLGGWAALDYDFGDSIDVSNFNHDVTTGEWTAVVWVLLRTIPAPDFDGVLGMNAFDPGLNYNMPVTGDWGAFWDGSSFNTGVVLDTNEWLHLVWTRQKDTLSCYRDSILDGAFDVSGKAMTNGTFHIGGRDSGGDLDGLLDDVSFYRRGFTSGEVSRLYQLSRQRYPGMLNRLPPISSGMIAAASLLPSNLPVYGQRRAAIGDPPVYGATIVRS